MMKQEMSSRYIIEEIKISDIIISKQIEDAMTEKVESEQLKLEKKYILDREHQEAEYNLKVQSTLTKEILQFKAIETAKEIVESTNSKTIIIGNGDGDLPIILGGP